MNTLEIRIPGIPAPGGSKRFVGFGKKTGRAILIDDAGQRNKDWRNAVAWAGKEALGQNPLMSGPLRVDMTFYMPRPKGHYGTKGLRTSAPAYPITRPDALKISRSTEDALTGIVWHDDAQTVSLHIQKLYASPDQAPGARVHILSLQGSVTE